MHSENIHKKGGMMKCSAHNTFQLFCCVCFTDQTVFLSIVEANEKTQSTVREFLLSGSSLTHWSQKKRMSFKEEILSFLPN